MGDLIFVLPTLIIFFFIIFQLLAFFKKGFDFVRKNFDLTIEDADQEINKRNKKIDQSYDQEEVKTRIAAAEKESFAKSKDRIIESSKKDSKKNNSKNINDKKKLKDNIKKQKSRDKSSSLKEIFADYSEVEKAVIYKEILSKPKALRKD